MKPIDKYDLYTRAVQDPPATADFLENVYRDLFRSEPTLLREDFCGAFALSHEWVTRSSQHRAIAIDKNKTPLNYGKKKYWNSFPAADRKRLTLYQKDVRAKGFAASHIICALNFSYCIFHHRKELLSYLKSCYESLHPKGMIALDCLGGAELADQQQTEADLADFTYFWDQKSFNPITRIARFQIHFQMHGGKKQLNQFNYHWRLWTLPELRDLLEEAGFKKSYVYWEGNDASESPQFSDTWVAYVVGKK